MLIRNSNLCLEQRSLGAEAVEAISAILGLKGAYDGLEIHPVVACLRQQVEGHPRNHAGLVRQLCVGIGFWKSMSFSSILKLIYIAFAISRKKSIRKHCQFFLQIHWFLVFKYHQHSWETSSRITHCVTFGARLRISNPRKRVAYSLADSAPSLSAFSSRFLLEVSRSSY